MNRESKRPGQAFEGKTKSGTSCWEIFQARIVELTKGWDEPSETQASYINNPSSHYYYTGRNPLRLLAKAALKLEHHFTTLPEGPDSNSPKNYQQSD